MIFTIDGNIKERLSKEDISTYLTFINLRTIHKICRKLKINPMEPFDLEKLSNHPPKKRARKKALY